MQKTMPSRASIHAGFCHTEVHLFLGTVVFSGSTGASLPQSLLQCQTSPEGHLIRAFVSQ